jgi:hypothetical protein
MEDGKPVSLGGLGARTKKTRIVFVVCADLGKSIMIIITEGTGDAQVEAAPI